MRYRKKPGNGQSIWIAILILIWLILMMNIDNPLLTKEENERRKSYESKSSK